MESRSFNIYKFDCSVLRCPIGHSSNKKNRYTSSFVFLFDISKITKLMKMFEEGNGMYFLGDLVL